MDKINFNIDQEDLKCLFIACDYKGSMDAFIKECEKGYADYHKRNIADLQKFGNPKTYSQWVNGQTIALTS